jgi:hypothetical protein
MAGGGYWYGGYAKDGLVSKITAITMTMRKMTGTMTNIMPNPIIPIGNPNGLSTDEATTTTIATTRITINATKSQTAVLERRSPSNASPPPGRRVERHHQ